MIAGTMIDVCCRYLASSSKDTTVKIWDTVLGTALYTLSAHERSVTCVRWGGTDLIYSSSQVVMGNCVKRII